jgi:hypothetical protein
MSFHGRARLRRLALMVATATLVGGFAATSVTTAASASVSRSIVKSKNFAGYFASLPTAVSTFTGTLSVPAVTCPATGSVALAPVVALSTSGNTLQFGNSVTCSNGTLSPQSFFAEIFPSGGGGPIATAGLATAPGDVVTMKLAIAAGVANLKISDARTGASSTASAPVGGLVASVNAGTQVVRFAGTSTVVPSFTPPVAFGTLKFGSATLASLSRTEFEIFNGSTLQVSTSNVSSAGSFKNTFVHS